MALYKKTTAPTANDDGKSGYAPGDLWLNTTTGLLYRCQANGLQDARWGPAQAQGIRDCGIVLLQAECAVGAATVPLLDPDVFPNAVPCARVWIGAPTVDHEAGGVNAGTVMVGRDPEDNISGGIPLVPDNSAGFYYPVADAKEVYLTGFNADDVVEYQIFA